jgi:hypothetical protein
MRDCISVPGNTAPARGLMPGANIVNRWLGLQSSSRAQGMSIVEDQKNKAPVDDTYAQQLDFDVAVPPP